MISFRPLSSGLLSLCEKQGVRGKQSRDPLGPGPPAWLPANLPNHNSSDAHAWTWSEASPEMGRVVRAGLLPVKGL